MKDFDLRHCLNIVSDVVINRPAPLREIDQIYMKAGDLLLHADHLASWFAARDVVFIGDGDAIALTLAHLHKNGLTPRGPKSVHVLDFDDRIVASVRRFAKNFGLHDVVTATYYNVADPFPEVLRGRFDAFHTNPPFGASNDGRSVEAFVRRGIESCKYDCRCCIVQADDDSLDWTQTVLGNTQKYIQSRGFIISEIRPKAHHYHLDDTPSLTSCSMLAKRIGNGDVSLISLPLEPEIRENFYGRDLPLVYARVRDRTAGGRFPSRDHELVRLSGENNVDPTD